METTIAIKLDYLGWFCASHGHYPKYLNGRDHCYGKTGIINAVKEGLKGIDEAKPEVKLWLDRTLKQPCIINGVEYTDIDIELRFYERSDISDVPYWSPLFKGRRDSWQSSLTDAARNKIRKDFTDTLNTFCFDNEPKLRQMLRAHYIEHELEKISELQSGFNQATQLLEAAQ